MTDKGDKALSRMIKTGIFPYIDRDTWKEIQNYYFEMIKQEDKWLGNISSFTEYMEWLNFKLIDFFSDIDEVKNHPDFNKFIAGYVAELTKITRDANEKGSQYGIEGDTWFYEPEEHAEKTKMFLKYTT